MTIAQRPVFNDLLALARVHGMAIGIEVGDFDKVTQCPPLTFLIAEGRGKGRLSERVNGCLDGAAARLAARLP